MRRKISPTILIVVIVLVIAVLATIGYFVMKSKSTGQIPDDARQQMQKAQEKAYQQRGGPSPARQPGGG